MNNPGSYNRRSGAIRQMWSRARRGGLMQALTSKPRLPYRALERQSGLQQARLLLKSRKARIQVLLEEIDALDKIYLAASEEGSQPFYNTEDSEFYDEGSDIEDVETPKERRRTPSLREEAMNPWIRRGNPLFGRRFR